ncbi:general odorant-binding protein 45-like [Armigeres subalbatus]|uniref:general odorant-binding protein 45-like n=1 Tax=Armigeres subalbatus TaxID=124917 RepID=UPI002ED32875
MNTKKRSILLLLLFGICIALNQASSPLEHAATLKSFDQLRIECAQYLPANSSSTDDDGGDGCSDRCLGLVGRFWNDTVGRPHYSVGRFYRQDPDDLDYINRTVLCMNETVHSLPPCAGCHRASCGMQCYQDQFGELVNQEPKFVPVPNLKGVRIINECALILQLSAEDLQHILEHGYTNTSESACLTRCLLIRAGLYSDSHGPNIERFSVQCEGYDDKYAETVTKCYVSLQEQELDKCSLAARVYEECIQINMYSNSNIDISTFVYHTLYGLGVAFEYVIYPIIHIL